MVYYSGALRMELTVEWFHAWRRRLADPDWAVKAAGGKAIEHSAYERSVGQPNCESA